MIRAACILGMLEAIHFLGCWATYLDSLSVTVTSSKHSNCQHCILADAGAIHVEEIKEVSDGKYSRQLWVLGPSKFTAANLIRCFGKNACQNIYVERMSSPIVVKGIGGSSQDFSAQSAPLRNHNSLTEEHSVSSLDVVKKLRLDVPPNFEAVDHAIMGHSSERSKPMCIFRHSYSTSALCEACLQKKSDAGPMEKYFLFHDHVSHLYVIATSNSNPFKDSCNNFEICTGSTSILSDHLCKLFRQKVSLQMVSSDVTKKVLLATEEMKENNQVISTTTEQRSGKRRSIVKKLTDIFLDSQCLSTTQAFGGNGSGCWGCLAKKYEGMVVLARFRLEKEDKGKFLIHAFTKKIVPVGETGPCSSNCGEIRESTECNLEPIHLINLAPPQNALDWMERFEISRSHGSIKSSSCFLVQHSLRAECRECFLSEATWELSPITFLVNVSRHLEFADNSKCLFNQASGCEEIDVMPGTMCEFEMLPVKVNLNINSASTEENQSSPIANSRKVEPVHVAKVVAFIWHIQKEEQINVSELHECFLCLTRKRKVVLISLTKRYLWMVVSDQAKQFMNCLQCVGKLIEAERFAYDLFLRQIQLLHLENAIDHSKKRKHETDAFEVNGKKIKSI